VEATAQLKLLQQPNITGTHTALGSNTSSSDSSSTNSSREVIRVCPAWAAEAATAGGALQVGNGSNASIVSFSADFNQAEHSGVTAEDRQAALAAAAAAAVEAAGSSLLSPGSNATEPPPVAFAPGLFEPLTVQEMLEGEGTDRRSSGMPCAAAAAVVACKALAPNVMTTVIWQLRLCGSPCVAATQVLGAAGPCCAASSSWLSQLGDNRLPGQSDQLQRLFCNPWHLQSNENS
jgi:hypothetical protein